MSRTTSTLISSLIVFAISPGVVAQETTSDELQADGATPAEVAPAEATEGDGASDRVEAQDSEDRSGPRDSDGEEPAAPGAAAPAGPPASAAAAAPPATDGGDAATPGDVGDRPAQPPAGGGPRVELPEELAEDDAPAVAAPAGEAGRVGSLPIGGYGELHYNYRSPSDGEASSVLDLHRMVLFVGHQFRFGLSFQLELEVEHAFVAGGDSPGEVAIEQAYVQYPIVGRWLGVRAGVVLVPMGSINQRHEPPTFNGVERPSVDRVIIPTTWREGGVGIYGQLADWMSYELYLVTGLDAGGFSLGSGLRGGRQHVGKAAMHGFGLTGRVDFRPLPWLTAGVSGYWGRSGPNISGLNASCDDDCAPLDLDVTVGGVSADFVLRWRGLEARGLFALFTVGDTAALRAAVDDEGVTAGPDVASMIFGAYVELGWDVLSLVETRHALVPFVRYEFYDTTFRHDDPTVEGSRATHDLVLGLGYRPIPQVAFKADVVLRNPMEGDVLFNLGVGWMF